MNLKVSLSTILTSTTLLFSSLAEAQPTHSIGSGATTLRPDSTFTSLLQNQGIKSRALEESTTVRGTVFFPIHEGVMDFATARGEIQHSGGQRLVNLSTAVRLMNYSIDTTQTKSVLTADVVVDNQLIGRIPLLNVQFSNLTTPLQARRGTLRFTKVKLTLTAEGATALNTAFDTTVFSDGQSYGTATVNMVLGKSISAPNRPLAKNAAE